MDNRDFSQFKEPVSKQFLKLHGAGLLQAEVNSDEMWNAYLDAFPEGTNQMYRTRREYDCSCCRQFVRQVGAAVALVNGKIETIWDVKLSDPVFQQVADTMAAFIRKDLKISNIYKNTNATAGAAVSYEQIEEMGKKTSRQWKHFFVQFPRDVVIRGEQLGTELSQKRGDHDVFVRSLEEFNVEACDTVLELIAQGSIYRGKEFKQSIIAFRQAMAEANTSRIPLSLYTWSKIANGKPLPYRFKNTSIGTLISDIADGEDLEVAVKKFESKVAPENYKRPTALVTPKMIADAKAKVIELGLDSALQRRYANLNDINVNDILFADRSISALQKDDIFGGVVGTAKPIDFKKVQEVSIDKFINDILPTAQSLEVYLENKHKNNLVSLVAPAEPTAKNLFKWNNGFSWSYAGDFTDAIKERVKAAGGNVDGDVSCRLAWDNTTDLDFHMVEPSGHEIYFGNSRMRSQCGGMLDVDANGRDGLRPDPVENIFYKSIETMRNGVYKLYVNTYNLRSRANEGYTVQLDILGDIYTFSEEKFPKGKKLVATLQKNGNEITVTGEVLAGSPRSQNVWGLDTNNFVRCNVVMNSPNHWHGSQVGNKHYFFMLDKCLNEGVARGFYNEFLGEELTPHRKVLEMVGSKMKTDEADSQLSGIGFSDTNRAELVVKVVGATTRILKIKI